MAINCENAFDTTHDEGKDDLEFLEGGVRHWGGARLYHKLDGIAKIIAAADTAQPVGVVCLCEVENDSILEYLTKRTPLRSMGYDYYITESEDARGVDVAILYSHLVFSPIMFEKLRPEYSGYPTRDILHVCGKIKGDTIDVYSVHLPSKLGGKESHDKGVQIARGLRNSVDSVLSSRTNAKVVVMGDFNSDLKHSNMSKTLRLNSYWSSQTHIKDMLYDVIPEKMKQVKGTYKYHGVWSVMDHILVSGNVPVDDAGVLVNSHLLEKDVKYGGVKPKRTYVGYKYNGGISDHLPVWVRFKW